MQYKPCPKALNTCWNFCIIKHAFAKSQNGEDWFEVWGYVHKRLLSSGSDPRLDRTLPVYSTDTVPIMSAGSFLPLNPAPKTRMRSRVGPIWDRSRLNVAKIAQLVSKRTGLDIHTGVVKYGNGKVPKMVAKNWRIHIVGPTLVWFLYWLHMEHNRSIINIT